MAEIDILAMFLQFKIQDFVSYDYGTLKHIAKSIVATVNPPGTVLCKEGVIGDRMFILIRGKVRVLKLAKHEISDEWIQNHVATLSELQCFGLDSLKTKKARSATCVCQIECLTLEIRKESLRGIVDYYQGNAQAERLHFLEQEMGYS